MDYLLRRVNVPNLSDSLVYLFTMKYENGADGVFHYVLGELSYDDFDKSGRMSMWKLSKLVEGSRHTSNLYGPHGNWRDATRTMTFVRSQYFKVYPTFYSRINSMQNVSVKFNTFNRHFGRTSYCLDCEIRVLTTNELLATVSTYCVLVSNETRRPTPIPSNALNFEIVIPSQDKRPVSGPEFPVRPFMYFTQKRTIMPSDTDSNEHLNQAAFIRFSFDCASIAGIQGKLSNFVNDIIYADAKEVWMLYVHEAKNGEELTLYCWEDKDLNRTIWVEISRGSQIIGQCQMQFYEDGLQISKSKVLTVAKL